MVHRERDLDVYTIVAVNDFNMGSHPPTQRERERERECV
jgi:hypothetical protein